MQKLNNLIDKEVPMAIAQTMRGTWCASSVIYLTLNCRLPRCQRHKVSVIFYFDRLHCKTDYGRREPDRAGRYKMVLST